MRDALKQLKLLQRQLETVHRAAEEVMLESERLIERLDPPAGPPAPQASRFAQPSEGGAALSGPGRSRGRKRARTR